MNNERKLRIPPDLAGETDLMLTSDLWDKTIWEHLNDRRGCTNKNDIAVIQSQKILKNTVYHSKKMGNLTFKDVFFMRMMLDHIKQVKASKSLYFALRDAILNAKQFGTIESNKA